jgi:prophage antirepressor-like protein
MNKYKCIKLFTKIFNNAELHIYENDNVNRNGLLFKAKDISNILGIKNINEIISKLDDPVLYRLEQSRDPDLCSSLYKTESQGSTDDEMMKSEWFFTEFGLYEILCISRKPLAKSFKICVLNIINEYNELQLKRKQHKLEFEYNLEKEQLKYEFEIEQHELLQELKSKNEEIQKLKKDNKIYKNEQNEPVSSTDCTINRIPEHSYSLSCTDPNRGRRDRPELKNQYKTERQGQNRTVEYVDINSDDYKNIKKFVESCIDYQCENNSSLGQTDFIDIESNDNEKSDNEKSDNEKSDNEKSDNEKSNNKIPKLSVKRIKKVFLTKCNNNYYYKIINTNINNKKFTLILEHIFNKKAINSLFENCKWQTSFNENIINAQEGHKKKLYMEIYLFLKDNIKFSEKKHLLNDKLKKLYAHFIEKTPNVFIEFKNLNYKIFVEVFENVLEVRAYDGTYFNLIKK